MYKVQSVIFDKNFYDKEKSLRFLEIHNFKYDKMDSTEKYLRFRQLDPKYLKRIGYNKVITKPITVGVSLIIFYNTKK